MFGSDEYEIECQYWKFKEEWEKENGEEWPYQKVTFFVTATPQETSRLEAPGQNH